MLRAMLFDCDGVLADTERVHWEAFNEVLLKLGLQMSWDEYVRRYLAYDDPTCFRAFLCDVGYSFDEQLINELVSEKRKLLYERSSTLSIATYPGVVDFVLEASKRYHLAVASGAARNEIMMVLNSLGIADCFRVVVSSEDVKHGKPHPEPFIKAMELLNDSLCLTPPLSPTNCLVIEDSIHGVKAAKSARMWCLAVTNTYPKEMLCEADFIVERLDPRLIPWLDQRIREASGR
jgi:HAD superfamily hydrolase (TIGR01509 family)